MFNSILDTDLYKLTMQQAVCIKFPFAEAKFQFMNRGKHKFSLEMYSDIQDYIESMESYKLTEDEENWLRNKCKFFTPVYIDFLKGYRFNPKEVSVKRDEFGNLDIIITGPWYRTILWEVPIMAIISEVYNRYNNSNYSYDSNYDSQKMLSMKDSNAYFADFGTRRRLNSQNHLRIVNIASACSTFVGTSNVYLAYKYNLKPIGTHAHEWFMFHAAKYGYREANHMALKNWAEIYHGNLGIALSDTYTTEKFLQDFDSKYARLFDGVRHDSGSPFQFGDAVIEHYKTLNIDPMTKTIVFSDNLNVDKVTEINDYFRDKIKCSFGIGTNLTNDIKNITPMNIVIKMTKCKLYGNKDWIQTIKLSDTKFKNTGSIAEIELCKKTLKIL